MAIARCAWELFGRKIHEGQPERWEMDTCAEEYKIIASIVSSVDIDMAMAALYSTLISTVGEKYYKDYLSKIENKKLSEREKIELMETERLLNPQAQSIFTATYIRTPLYACFFLFKDAIVPDTNREGSKGFANN